MKPAFTDTAPLLLVLSLNYSETDDVITLYGAQCDLLILFEWLN